MKSYLYNYQTIIRFSSPISQHFFRLRCMPCQNACQRVMGKDLFIYPADNLAYGMDAWGNPFQYGSILESHDSFVFVSSGEIGLMPYGIPGDDTDDVFRAQSKLTVLSKEMKDFAYSIGNFHTPFEYATRLSQQLYSYMRYEPGCTAMDTTAEVAFKQKQGVCQDYAHILIALCRERNIAARYVNGFMQGIGATHAWVEVFDGDVWRGIDPTNNSVIEYGYIKLSHGRDANDCPVNRGTFIGISNQQVEIRVIVEEL